MSTAIRYYSKFGHSKQMAEVVGKELGVQPQTVDTPLTEPVDTLFLGAGVFLGKVNSAVVSFIQTLKPEQVRRVVLFGSCAIIKSPVPQMQSLLESQGITVDAKSFTCKGSMGPLHGGHPDKQDLENLRQFVAGMKQ